MCVFTNIFSSLTTHMACAFPFHNIDFTLPKLSPVLALPLCQKGNNSKKKHIKITLGKNVIASCFPWK